jgi:calcium permeable stress-gated cation channel
VSNRQRHRPSTTNIPLGLIYSVISPLILIFNCITFSLFWFVFRYNTLYVTKFEFDTGGLLFPKAINHTFIGLYVMEICLIGLFFLETGVNPDGSPNYGVCVPQGVIMVISLIFTVLFHFLLNSTFGPLIRYLPITLEDEAVARDEEFARAQGQRFNLAEEEHDGDDINDVLEARERKEEDEDEAAEAYEMKDIANRKSHHRLDPRSLAHSAGDRLHAVTPNWATATRRSSAWLYNPQAAQDGNARVDDLIRAHRLRRSGLMENGAPPMSAESTGAKSAGAKSQGGKSDQVSTAIGDALFAGISDEIEDLSPEDRDFLVQRAFQHAALRARRPIVWIPRDDLGISDDEVARTRTLSESIWISNEHTGLDSKVRVVYRKSPPDFSEVDLIYL